MNLCKRNAPGVLTSSPRAFLFMKRPKKKLLTIGKLKAKADRALQDYFRRIKQYCEMCGRPYQVAHHFIYKSSSNYLRYDERNLVFCCNGCHYKFHPPNPDPEYPVIVANRRGEEWVDYIRENRHKLKRDNRIELEELLIKYKL